MLGWRLFSLFVGLLVAEQSLCREVCMTCYADSGPCHIPPGYNVNCIYVSIIAGPNHLCFTSAGDVYGSKFDLKQFALDNNLTTYGMLNANAATRKTVAADLEKCHNAIVALGDKTSWPPLGNNLNIDWEPCTGTPPWPSMPFRLDIGNSVQCLSNLPSTAVKMEMVYDGAQLKYLQGKEKFDCTKRYMFATEKSKILGPQTGSVGGMTPAMFIEQCGDDADYDIYTTGKQYLDPSLTAACGADMANFSCAPKGTGSGTQPKVVEDGPAASFACPQLTTPALTMLVAVVGLLMV